MYINTSADYSAVGNYETKSVMRHLLKLTVWDRYESYYWTISNFYAFGKGFMINKLWANSTVCFDRMTNFTYVKLPRFLDGLVGVTNISIS